MQAATTFYRGFELTSTVAPDEMGHVVFDAMIISGKRRAFKPVFKTLLSDLGGLTQTFVPRDPVVKNIVYVSTNHQVRAEGGREGVFIIWKYNIDTGVYSRLDSFRYSTQDAPLGFDIIGNEGTSLIIIKNIDSPYCERDLQEAGDYLFRSLDMRNTTKGFSNYSPSASMRAAYRALPECLTVGPDLTLRADRDLISQGVTTSSVLTASFADVQLPTGSHLEIRQLAAGSSGTIVQTCTTSVCRAVVTESGMILNNNYLYRAFVVGADGRAIHESEIVRIQYAFLPF